MLQAPNLSQRQIILVLKVRKSQTQSNSFQNSSLCGSIGVVITRDEKKRPKVPFTLGVNGTVLTDTLAVLDAVFYSTFWILPFGIPLSSVVSEEGKKQSRNRE